MRWCNCNEKVIEISSAEFMKDVSKYTSMVKSNTIVRVVSEGGCRLTISAPSISDCEKCNSPENEI